MRVTARRCPGGRSFPRTRTTGWPLPSSCSTPTCTHRCGLCAGVSAHASQNSPVKKMARADFAKFLRGLNDGKDFSLLLIRACDARCTARIHPPQDVYESVARQELPYYQGLAPPTDAPRSRGSPGTPRKIVSLVGLCCHVHALGHLRCRRMPAATPPSCGCLRWTTGPSPLCASRACCTGACGVSCVDVAERSQQVDPQRLDQGHVEHAAALAHLPRHPAWLQDCPARARRCGAAPTARAARDVRSRGPQSR